MIIEIISKLLVLARNSDWLVALFAPVVIGKSNWFDIGFSTVIGNWLYNGICFIWMRAIPYLNQNMEIDLHLSLTYWLFLGHFL